MLHWFMPRHTAAPQLAKLRSDKLPASAASAASAATAATKRAVRKTAAKKKKTARLRSPLEVIPGVGPAAAGDFHRLGIFDVPDLKGRDPQALFDKLIEIDGHPHDRCVLYVIRAAVYYASTTRHDPEKLKWWNWKDTPPPRKAR